MVAIRNENKMQRSFTIKELAAFLRRSEKELTKLAEREILRGRKIQGVWNFSTPDVAQWMEREMTIASDADASVLEEIAAKEVLAEEEFSLAKMLAPELVDLNLPAKTKNSVLIEIAKTAEKAGKIWDAAEMTTALQEREKLGSTAIDLGIAVLHPRRPKPELLAEDFLAVGITSKKIPFGGEFNVVADVFFLLGCGSDEHYLRALGRLMRVARRDGFIDELRECETPRDAVELFVKGEAEL